ncbi:PTS transporter subunit EIIB [Streptococcus thoraltensis]|uniref:PTS transporter subunit EIIB n=1 Tax=Streptococcus thoraltensis TaxID=55085 RepID=UPI002A817B10|nr:PTS transporter subunit EIIB [Streptococcus thoraltensis]MDY4760461.1 hypothetical protein [Streptococcus thoraltensis]
MVNDAYKQTATSIIESVGGQENISTAVHCATSPLKKSKFYSLTEMKKEESIS